MVGFWLRCGIGGGERRLEWPAIMPQAASHPAYGTTPWRIAAPLWRRSTTGRTICITLERL